MSMLQDNKLSLAIITSGGDAPGMNNIIAHILKYSNGKYRVLLVRNAFRGLVENDFIEPDGNAVITSAHSGGTILGSLRFPQFEKLEFQKKAVANLQQRQIDVLIIAGGNGSYRAAQSLAKLGIKVICIPTTIDNDVDSTDFTVGFATALETIQECVSKIVTTARSHSRISLVEVMGRYCPDLTNFSAVVCDADVVITRDHYLEPKVIISRLQTLFKHQNSALVLVAEKIYGEDGKPTLLELASIIEQNLRKQVNTCVLGYIQRGGKPSAFDCMLSGMMCYYTMKLIQNGEFNKMICYRNGTICALDLNANVPKKKWSLLQECISLG